MSADPGADAHQAAEQHLNACFDALSAEEELPLDEWPESPASAPFCGCQTCVIREALHAAWPILEAAAEARNAR